MTSLRRVLIIGNFLSSHGAARGVCEELAPRLRQAGWTVHTASDRRGRATRLAHMMTVVWNRRHEYDVAQIDLYSGPAFFWAEAVCWLLRLIGRPYVLTLHGGRLPEFASVRQERMRRLLGSATAVTVPSAYLLHQMAPYRDGLTYLPNALDVAAYPAVRHSVVRPRLIWLRAFHRVYNPGMAVRTLAELKDEFPSIQLTMVGPDKGDSSWEQTKAAAKAHQVEAHLSLLGPLPKASVPSLLEQGDIFLNTSNADNTPVTVLEAMASNMCVVSTTVGGIPYLLKASEDALLVPPDDHVAMAAAIRCLLTDADCAEKIRAASIKKVRQFDWSVILPQWNSLLENAALSVRTASFCVPQSGAKRLS